jgi:low affinity Fe/Cu permease
MDVQVKTCPSSIADMEGQIEELIKFLEYEESITIDSATQERIRAKLIELGVWQLA